MGGDTPNRDEQILIFRTRFPKIYALFRGYMFSGDSHLVRTYPDLLSRAQLIWYQWMTKLITTRLIRLLSLVETSYINPSLPSSSFYSPDCFTFHGI